VWRSEGSAADKVELRGSVRLPLVEKAIIRHLFLPTCSCFEILRSVETEWRQANFGLSNCLTSARFSLSRSSPSSGPRILCDPAELLTFRLKCLCFEHFPCWAFLRDSCELAGILDVRLLQK
jgi:hypothetical protein